jgi:glycosyltransferase involved in cell wall biosynthesis
MRVLHVIDTSELGGGQTALRHLLEGFRDSDVTTDLACRPGGPLVDAAAALGTRVHAIPFDKRYRPGQARALAAVIRDRKIDLMHSHGLLATYYCTLARSAFGARVPLVYHQHGFHHHNHGALTRRLRISAERFLASRADAVIAVSRADRAQLLSEQYAPPARVRVIHYGLPQRPPDPTAIDGARRALGANGSPVVGLVARLHPQKGVDTFLRAAAIVRREHPDVLFAVVGVGALEHEMRGLAGTLGLNGEVRWLTSGVQGAAAMPLFSVGVLSSRWEGLPLVLLEYMAAARPIVATTVEGCLDAVSSAEAELVPPDSPQAMAAAISRLLTDGSLARERAAAALARFQQAFTLDVMVGHVRQVYKEVSQ